MDIKRYLTNCVVSSNGEAIEEMVDGATQITRRTFIKHVAWPDLLELEASLGYADHYRRGMTMAADWHIRYNKSTYQGKPCVYIVHSAIERIFV